MGLIFRRFVYKQGEPAIFFQNPSGNGGIKRRIRARKEQG